MREGVSPYIRFVQGERDRIAGTEAKLANARKGLQSIQEQVERLFA
jgi:hypothetical protein